VCVCVCVCVRVFPSRPPIKQFFYEETTSTFNNISFASPRPCDVRECRDKSWRRKVWPSHQTV